MEVEEIEEWKGKKTGCITRAAMVTVIHVFDTLEQTQSLPSPPLSPSPVAGIPLSVCLSGRPPCVPGRVTVQSATTKEEARHCYGKHRRTKAAFPPPSTTALITHSRPTDLVALTRPGRRARMESGQTSSRDMNFFAVNPEPLMLMFIC